MKIALVHDYLYDYGGAERILETLHEIWPQAPIYTAWVDWSWLKTHKTSWLKWDIRPSWFQKIPYKHTLTSPLRFLAPYIWESFDFNKYDLVISSTAWFITKGIITKPETLHACYCHTPPRYLYGYKTSRDWKKSWTTRTYAAIINPPLRMYDYLAAQRVDKFITNSQNTARRIKKFYRRNATVIYPPVSLSISSKSYQLKTKSYFLMVNRLVQMKRVDIAIKAAIKSQINLKIAGTGRDEKRLKTLAKNHNNIKFLGYVNDKKLHYLYANCQAVLYLAQDEDFGITPVEAMSFGKPVIAVNGGGIKESVIHNQTGILINDLTASSLMTILRRFNSAKFKSKTIKAHAQKFSQTKFKNTIKAFVKTEYKKLIQ